MSGNAEPYGKEGLPLEDARRRVLAAIQPIDSIITLPLHEALGRVNASALTAPAAVPGFRASVMDGYALGQFGSSYQVGSQSSLRVVSIF